jgi:hypothetical protein
MWEMVSRMGSLEALRRQGMYCTMDKCNTQLSVSILLVASAFRSL